MAEGMRANGKRNDGAGRGLWCFKSFNFSKAFGIKSLGLAGAYLLNWRKRALKTNINKDGGRWLD